MELARLPEPPYYAVIFTSRRAGVTADDGYDAMSDRMFELAAEQPGFLGVDSARSGVGITVSYWTDERAIRDWKRNSEHVLAQQEGAHRWYDEYEVRVARVERAYGFRRQL